jgi:hypothetical protein
VASTFGTLTIAIGGGAGVFVGVLLGGVVQSFLSSGSQGIKKCCRAFCCMLIFAALFGGMGAGAAAGYMALTEGGQFSHCRDLDWQPDVPGIQPISDACATGVIIYWSDYDLIRPAFTGVVATMGGIALFTGVSAVFTCSKLQEEDPDQFAMQVLTQYFSYFLFVVAGWLFTVFWHKDTSFSGGKQYFRNLDSRLDAIYNLWVVLRARYPIPIDMEENRTLYIEAQAEVDFMWSSRIWVSLSAGPLFLLQIFALWLARFASREHWWMMKIVLQFEALAIAYLCALQYGLNIAVQSIPFTMSNIFMFLTLSWCFAMIFVARSDLLLYEWGATVPRVSSRHKAVDNLMAFLPTVFIIIGGTGILVYMYVDAHEVFAMKRGLGISLMIAGFSPFALLLLAGAVLGAYAFYQSAQDVNTWIVGRCLACLPCVGDTESDE